MNDANDLKRDRPDVARATHLLSRDEARRIVNIAKLPELLRDANLAFKPNIAATLAA